MNLCIFLGQILTGLSLLSQKGCKRIGWIQDSKEKTTLHLNIVPNNKFISIYIGREWSEWCQELRVPGDQLEWRFTSDGSVNGWGWKFTVHPIMPAEPSLDSYSDRTILSKVQCMLYRCDCIQKCNEILKIRHGKWTMKITKNSIRHIACKIFSHELFCIVWNIIS